MNTCYPWPSPTLSRSDPINSAEELSFEYWDTQNLKENQVIITVIHTTVASISPPDYTLDDRVRNNAVTDDGEVIELKKRAKQEHIKRAPTPFLGFSFDFGLGKLKAKLEALEESKQYCVVPISEISDGQLQAGTTCPPVSSSSTPSPNHTTPPDPCCTSTWGDSNACTKTCICSLGGNCRIVSAPTVKGKTSSWRCECPEVRKCRTLLVIREKIAWN